VVAFGNPYLLQQIPDVGTYVIAWGGFPVSQRAAARALLGIAPITGKLPIAIPPLVPLGAGKTIADASASGSR
jgi:beta-N-acetylhexosaminidase